MVGGQAPKAIRSVECYDFEEDRWDQIAELPSRRCRAGERHHLSSRSLPFPSLSPLTAGNPPLLLVSTNICALQTLFFFLLHLPNFWLPLLESVLTCVGTSRQVKYLLESHNIGKTYMNRNPVSPMMTSGSVKLEITVCRDLFMGPSGSPIVIQRHCMSDQPLEMNSFSWFPVPQVWCSWLVTCMLWAGLMARCACGQWMCMMA